MGLPLRCEAVTPAGIMASGWALPHPVSRNAVGKTMPSSAYRRIVFIGF
jgi:hypothetical protein